MKIEIRGSGRSPRPSSAGGSTCVTIETRPSAGATTMPSRTGVTRTGSRKNSAHQSVSKTPIQPSGVQIQNRIRVASAKPPINGYPSGWIGGICARMELASDIKVHDHLSPLPLWERVARRETGRRKRGQSGDRLQPSLRRGVPPVLSNISLFQNLEGYYYCRILKRESP